MSEPRKKAPAWAWILATGFGSGLLKPAPGTWGSAAAVAAWLVWRLFTWGLPGAAAAGWLWYGVLPALALTWIGIRASDRVAEAEGLEDPGFIVIDEWAGQWLALAPLWALPVPPALLDWRVLVPFALFRLFDIWKPGLVRRLQDLHGGLGIMIDDVAAGCYAALITAMVLPFLH